MNILNILLTRDQTPLHGEGRRRRWVTEDKGRKVKERKKGWKTGKEMAGRHRREGNKL